MFQNSLSGWLKLSFSFLFKLNFFSPTPNSFRCSMIIFFFLILRCSLIRLFALISIICLQLHSFCFHHRFFLDQDCCCVYLHKWTMYTQTLYPSFLKFFQSIQIKHNIIVNCSVFPEWIHNKPMMMMMIFDITDNSMTDQPSDLRLYWRKKMRSKKNKMSRLK